jgi:hypothetical protein
MEKKYNYLIPKRDSSHEYKSAKTYSGMGPLSVVHSVEG